MSMGRGPGVGSSLSEWGVWRGKVGGVAGLWPGLGAAGGKVLSPGHGTDSRRREGAAPVAGLRWSGLQGAVVSHGQDLQGWLGAERGRRASSAGRLRKARPVVMRSTAAIPPSTQHSTWHLAGAQFTCAGGSECGSCVWGPPAWSGPPAQW